MHSRKGKKEKRKKGKKGKREKADEMPPALDDDCLRMPFPWCSGYQTLFWVSAQKIESSNSYTATKVPLKCCCLHSLFCSMLVTPLNVVFPLK